MTQTVWKYFVRGNLDTIEMPKGAQIIKAAIQHEQVAIWALVDPVQPSERRTFAVVGTGHPFDWKVKHVETFFTDNRNYVWHVLEVL